MALFALILAMPVALGIAIFLSQYSPRRVTGPLAYVVDLLAAVPSIIYGVWGLYVLAPQLRPIATWLNEHLGGVFLFATGNASVSGGGTIFTAGIVLAVMILPIITAVTREVFMKTPQGHIEAALALGATRWEVVKTAVLPFGRSGYISGAMLGLGRALGETIALLIILRGTQAAFGWSLFDGGYTFATKIAATAYEFNNQYKAGAYIAAGLVLFVLTLRGECDGACRRRGQGHADDLDPGPPAQGADVHRRESASTARQCRCDRAGYVVGRGGTGAADLGAVLGSGQRIRRGQIQ